MSDTVLITDQHTIIEYLITLTLIVPYLPNNNYAKCIYLVII